MQRRRISRNLEAGKYLMILVAALLTILLVFAPKDTNTLIPGIIFLVLSGILYYLFSIATTVEFDEQYLFISGKTRSETIPLKNVSGIKLTMTTINNDNFWKIKYTGVDGSYKAIRILPKRDNFELFKKAVKERNPNVEIKNWSHSFDLDQ